MCAADNAELAKTNPIIKKHKTKHEQHNGEAESLRSRSYASSSLRIEY